MAERTKEEQMFYDWLTEAAQHDLLFGIAEQAPTFDLIPKQAMDEVVQMKTKSKVVSRSIFQPLTYTVDFSFSLTFTGLQLLGPVFKKSMLVLDDCMAREDPSRIYVDVKGGFTPQHAQTEAFNIKRKLTLYKYGCYVEKIVPWRSRGACLFKDTWVPESMRWKKNRRNPAFTKMGIECKAIGEFIQENKGGDKNESK